MKQSTSSWKNTIVINQTNRGPAIATQVGIKHSSGDYIKLVGGDDVMAPFCSELLLKTIKKRNSVAAFSSYKLVNTFENINYGENIISNYRIIKNPLMQTIKS